MKKFYTVLILIFLILTGLSFNSCKKDKTSEPDSANCDALSNAYYQAVVEYSQDPTNTEKCENLVDAATNYANNCMILTPQQQQELQDAIDNADCSN